MSMLSLLFTNFVGLKIIGSERAKFCILLSVLSFLFTSQVHACDRANHDWKQVFILDFSTSSPLSPILEIDLVAKIFTPSTAKEVIWIAEKNWLNQMMLIFKTTSHLWSSNLNWLQINPDEKIDFGDEKLKAGTILLKPEKNRIKVALFCDQNSSFNCYQIVFLVYRNLKIAEAVNYKPKEFLGRGWVSIKFWKLPTFKSILSIKAFPVRGHSKTFYENDVLANKLIKNQELKEKSEADELEEIDRLPGL